MKHLNLLLILLSAMILTGCAIPYNHTYFEVSSKSGKTFDAGYCDNWTEEPNAIELNIDGSLLVVRQISHINNRKLTYPKSKSDMNWKLYRIELEFEPAQHNLAYNVSMFTLTDNKTGKAYLPIDVKEVSGSINKYNGFMTPREAYVDKFLLVYDVLKEDLEDFQLTFPKGSIKQNGEDVELAPINFKKKSKTSMAYVTLNC